ncbi:MULTISPECIES: hypothetical protein [unclassified Methanoculleus]|jgi:hypothetical protein|uniref:Uncharacterized protein n=1 Tax=Methanoculleus palmolei TaxID=72612 RepID=A0ABD8A8U0_9EURY|nr:hypothetical protein [Methanoculleus sp. UBA377]MDD2473643.1 hypothetical protein [Methanoculleus sp.]WOX55936.1 hypothetical protein R6Y95_01035 [Methanoculleus palmolei]
MNPADSIIRGFSTPPLREGRDSGIERLGRGVDTMKKPKVVGGTDIRSFPFGRELLSGYRLVMIADIDDPATVDISRYPGGSDWGR